MTLTCSTLLAAASSFGIVLASAAQTNATGEQPAEQPATQPEVSETPAEPIETAEIEAAAPAEDAAAASNPLSSTSKLDLRFDYFDIDGNSDRVDYSIRGDLMIHPRVKLIYEAHYWSTDITGSNQDDWERVSLKPIWFVKDSKLGDNWKTRVALGGEWILDADNADQGIGSGSDQIAPLFGVAFTNTKSKLTLIPLIQHFESYEGPDVSTTAIRMIALKPLPESMWLRLDLKVPLDWENDTVPATFEAELGKMLNSKIGIYGTGAVGLGGDRPYDWGLGPAIRFRF